MTYSELVTKIRNYTEVGSEVLTSSVIDGFKPSQSHGLFARGWSLCDDRKLDI